MSKTLQHENNKYWVNNSNLPHRPTAIIQLYLQFKTKTGAELQILSLPFHAIKTYKAVFSVEKKGSNLGIESVTKDKLLKILKTILAIKYLLDL